jgi:chemotaxis protein methyltransferase WspC
LAIARIESLLKARIGLDAASIGTASIERAVRERCAASDCRDAQAYLDLVLTSEVELQELIEAVVVPESWFFRDRQAFVALAGVAQKECLRKGPEGVLRVLSLPCSTGEEPYSMVMTLLDAGIPAPRFQVDAVDISARALAKADAGIYGKNSFRDKDVGYRDGHFAPMGSAYCLNESVRRQVCFRQGNLFDAGSFFGARTFDAIFCRNVLIYFDRPTQLRVVEILNRLLAATGLLFVGPSETGVLQDQGFVTAKLPLAFAFRKALAIGHEPRPAPVRLSKPVPVARANARAPAAIPKPKQRSSPALALVDSARPAVPKSWIEEAQQLADRGNLLDALKHCEQHIDEETTSAAAFYLLGLLHDAAGRSQQACEQYRKALYLDAGHTEALVHLAVALRRDGDARGAQLLLDRAKRVQAAGSK